MKRLNHIDIDTRWGYRSFELWNGDLTQPDLKADLLIISAIEGSYRPTQDSVIGALHRAYGLDFHQLSDTRAIDLGDALRCWVSPPIQDLPFSRLMCVEFPYGGIEGDQIVEQCFLALPIIAAKGISLTTVMLPLLGAGSHGLDPGQLIRPILQGSLSALRSIESLLRVCFIELDADRADQLNDAMNAVLGRARIALAKGSVVDALRSEIRGRLDRLEALEPAAHRLHNELRLSLLATESRSYDLGRAGRLLAEHVVGHLLDGNKKRSLHDGINSLRPTKLSQWVLSYLDLLRVFGNEAVHHKMSDRHPPSMSPDDLVVCFLAIDRILEFWIQWLQMKRTQKPAQ